MHPHTYHSTLFNHTKRDEVFVIMSFGDDFESRWPEVIEPCIREDMQLKPNRVDYNISGESIVHDILDGIAHARLVIADITSTRMLDSHGQVWPQRNGNVMWELGIAHTMRMPDEVIVIRSDDDPTIFDLTQFRAFPYDPANISEARKTLKMLMTDRLRSIDQVRSDYVRRCADSLDFVSWKVLLQTFVAGFYKPPVLVTMMDVIGNTATLPAIERLLEMGALTTSYLQCTPEILNESDTNDLALEQAMRYETTPLAEAILKQIGIRMGMESPEMQPIMDKLWQEKFEAPNQCEA